MLSMNHLALLQRLSDLSAIYLAFARVRFSWSRLNLDAPCKFLLGPSVTKQFIQVIATDFLFKVMPKSPLLSARSGTSTGILWFGLALPMPRLRLAVTARFFPI